jgi:cell division protein FtsQ
VSAYRWTGRTSRLAALLRLGTGNRRRRGSAAGTARTRSSGRRRNPRRLLALAAVLLLSLAALAAGGWMWLRDSSFVAVRRVTITGVSGPDAGAIRGALFAAARTMTTLDVKRSDLLMAVAPYPAVKDVVVSTQFPHGMRIRVVEQVPVGAVLVAGREETVASDGTLLADVPAKSWYPLIPLRVPAGGTRVTEPGARAAVAVLAAAPYVALRKIKQVTEDATHGLFAELRNGPRIYFGPATQLSAKWTSALTVLADPGAAGAGYIDVTDPQRPAAGIGADQPSAPVALSFGVPGGASSSTGG